MIGSGRCGKMGPYHVVDGRCGLGFCWDSWISVGEDGDEEKEKGREGDSVSI